MIAFLSAYPKIIVHRFNPLALAIMIYDSLNVFTILFLQTMKKSPITLAVKLIVDRVACQRKSQIFTIGFDQKEV